MGTAGLGDVLAPKQLPASGWSEVATGIDFSCGLRGGQALCWGYNAHGQLGRQSASSPDATPTAIAITTSFVKIAVGARHVCGVTAAGMMQCWGHNDVGQLGDGTATDRTTPVTVRGEWTAISLGERHSCGLQGGALFCWGSNAYAQLGTPMALDQLGPVRIGTFDDWEQVAAGQFHTCATRAGSVYCWGSQQFGAVGDGAAWRAELARVH